MAAKTIVHSIDFIRYVFIPYYNVLIEEFVFVMQEGSPVIAVIVAVAVAVKVTVLN